MAPKRISAKEVLIDIRAGVSSAEIGQKYGISDNGTQRLFDQLLTANMLTQEERRRLSAPSDPSPELTGDNGSGAASKREIVEASESSFAKTQLLPRFADDGKPSAIRPVISNEPIQPSLFPSPSGPDPQGDTILIPIEATDAPTAEKDPKSGRSIHAGLIALAFKLGPKLFAALASLFKTLKLGKVGLAATSMAVYSYMFTWQFALMIMIMLFVHESGHIWAMKRHGLNTKGIYFIPFFGGAAVSDGEFPSRASESFIALMGPIWGLGLSVLVGIGYFVTEDPLYAAVASWGAMINLFNLLPINPLDGGRVFKSIAYSIGSGLGLAFLIVGWLVGGYLAFKLGMGLFLFLLIVGGLELLFEYKRRVEIPKMTGNEVLTYILIYVSVTAVLWTLMSQMKHVPGADIAMDMLR